MRILSFFLFYISFICFDANANNTNDLGSGKNTILIVVDEQKDKINLDPQLHEISKKEGVQSVLNFRSYVNDYHAGSTDEEVLSYIRNSFGRDSLFFVSHQADACQYGFFSTKLVGAAEQNIIDYLNSTDCHLNASLLHSSEPARNQKADALVTTSENTLPLIFFRTSERIVEKFNTSVIASLTRSGSDEELANTSEVVVYSYPITAEENVDFVPFSKVVRFPPGETRVLFSFDIFESDGVSDEFGVGLRYPVNAILPDETSDASRLIVKLYSETAQDTFTVKTAGVPFYKEGEDHKVTVSRLNVNQSQIVEYSYELVGLGPEFSFNKTDLEFTPGIQSIDLVFKVNDDFIFNSEPRYVKFLFKESPKVSFPEGSIITLPIGDNRRAERGVFGFEFSKYVYGNGNGSEHSLVKVIRKNSSKGAASFIVSIKDIDNAYISEQLVQFKEGETQIVLSLDDAPKTNNKLKLDLLPQVDVEMFTRSAEVSFVNPADEAVVLDVIKTKTSGNQIVEGGDALNLALQRTGALDYVGYLNVDVIGGTAVEGVDYVITNKSFLFGLGTQSTPIVISAINDEVFSGNLTIKLKLSSSNMKVPAEEIVIEILEDDYSKLGVIGFGAAQLNVEEDQTNYPFKIVRSIAGPAVEITIDAVDGTAKAGVDYEWAGPRTVRFNDGEAEAVIYLNMIGDSLPDFDKQFTLKLSSLFPITFGVKELKVNLVDNEKNKAIYVRPTGSQIGSGQGVVANLTTSSDNKFVTVTLTRTVNTTEAFRLNVTSVDGSAKAGIDYKQVNETLLFGSGELSKQLSITILKSSIVGAYSDFTLHMTADTPNFIVENPALQIKITPTVVAVSPGGESSGGSISWFVSLLMFFAVIARRRLNLYAVRG